MASALAKIKYGILEYWGAVRSFKANARLFLLGSILTNIGFSAFSLLFNLYLREGGFSEEIIGRILSFGSLGTILMALPSAYILRKAESRKILIVSNFFASLGYLSQAIYLSAPFLMGANLFTGSMLVLTRLISSPFFMRNSSPKERAHLFAFSMAAGVLAGVFGNLLGGYLPHLFQGMGFGEFEALKFSLASGSVIAIFGATPYLFIRENRVEEGISRFPRPSRETKIHLIKLTIPYALIGMGAGLIIPFLNLYFKEVMNASTDQIGIYFAVLQALMVLGFLIGPVLSKKFGLINTIVGTQLISIPFMLILALAPSLPLVVISFWIRGVLMNMSSPIQNLFNMEAVPPENRELANSLTAFSWNGAWTISAFLGGTIIHRYSFNLSFYLTIGLYLASSLVYFFFFRNFEKRRLS